METHHSKNCWAWQIRTVRDD